MPQPLSRMRKVSFNIANSGEHPLLSHPELGLLIAEVIASWANVEAFMLRLFIAMMGGPAERAATVFFALDTQSAKTKAINAIAVATLSEEKRNVLAAIQALAKSQQKERDAIAHGVWGWSFNLPDALLLMKASDAVINWRDRSKILVYRSADFNSIIERNERLSCLCGMMHMVITKHVSADSLFLQLCSEPEIREKLDRQAERERSAPAGCTPPPDAWHQNSCDQDPPAPE